LFAHQVGVIKTKNPQTRNKIINQKQETFAEYTLPCSYHLLRLIVFRDKMGGNSRKIRSELEEICADWDDYTREECGAQETEHLNIKTIAPPLHTLTQKLDLDRLITKESSDRKVPKKCEKEHSKEEDCSQTKCRHNSDHSARSRASFEQELMLYSRNRDQAKNRRSVRSEEFHIFLDLAVGEVSPAKTINEHASLVTLLQNELKRQCKDYKASHIGDGQPGGSLVVKCASFKAAVGVVWRLIPIEGYACGGCMWDVHVVPLEGCQWSVCKHIGQELEAKLGLCFGTRSCTNSLQHCKLFFSLSLKIINLNEWLEKRLGSFLPFQGTEAASCVGWIIKGLNRANLPVGQCFGAFEQIDALVNTVLPQRATTQAGHSCFQPGAVCGNRCIVCFDDFDTTHPAVKFSECGHQACVECVR
jgi:hypothetical protein